jgi:negative regulator of sigma E activity
MINNKRKERISAFLDNDMHRDELMSFSLSAEPEDAEIAQRYQLMGEALRGELSESSFVDVSHAVREALANENIAAENKSQQTPVKSASSSVKSRPLDSLARDLSAWFRPVAGMAVAVTVAVVMVMTLSEQQGSSYTPMAANEEGQPSAVQANTVAIGNNLPGSDQQNKDIDEKMMGIDPYINQHLEYATQDALQGRLPYVRAVSYETERK